MNENIFPFDESLVSAFLDDELSAPERQQVELAIQNSTALQKLVKDLTNVRLLVAASAPQSERLTKSLQSDEWLKSTNPNTDDSTETLPLTTNGQSSCFWAKRRLSVGLLASLAAMILVFVAINSLLELVNDAGPQIAMDIPPTSTPVPSAARASPAFANAAQEGMASAMSTPLSAPISAIEASPTVSDEAKEFLTYLEKNINAGASLTNSDRWTFIIQNAIPDQTIRYRSELTVDSTVTNRARSILVVPGSTEDEIVLHMTDDEFHELLKLLGTETTLPAQKSDEEERIATATPQTRNSEPTTANSARNETAALSTPDAYLKEWNLEITTPGEASFSTSASKMADTMLDGAGGIAGGASGYTPEASNSAGTGGDERLKPNSLAMRSAKQADRGDKVKPAELLGASEAEKFTFAEESTNMASSKAGSHTESQNSPNAEKLKRIRIKIKKDPVSSDSSE